MPNFFQKLWGLNLTLRSLTIRNSPAKRRSKSFYVLTLAKQSMIAQVLSCSSVHRSCRVTLLDLKRRRHIFGGRLHISSNYFCNSSSGKESSTRSRIANYWLVTPSWHSFRLNKRSGSKTFLFFSMPSLRRRILNYCSCSSYSYSSFNSVISCWCAASKKLSSSSAILFSAAFTTYTTPSGLWF